MDMVFLMFLISIMEIVFCASNYTSNNLFTVVDINSTNEVLCNQESEKFVQGNGTASSIKLELHPGTTHGSCKRLFTPPESHGFFVRLNKIKHNNENININDGSKIKNTGSCPLSIFSPNDPLLPPWRIDPCHLEIIGGLQEPVRVLEGRIKIIWNHDGNKPSYNLRITVLGRGALCKQTEKHICLSFGHDPVFCISEGLICDGIRHCPSGIEYDSDEDYDMCENKRASSQKKMHKNTYVWEKLSIELFWKIFTTVQSTEITVVNNNFDNEQVVEKVRADVKPVKDRGSLTTGIAKYGPWGYLMLGMLICGAALLICGLWECCCRRHKPLLITNDVLVTTDFSPDNQNASPVTPIPPIYDEIDPPPSYSILFPNLKELSDTNNQHEQMIGA